ncbi:MAG: RNA pyrophosphohydrolase [Alphaproteobacteria bacterium]|nr:RNA pyrophosphohydrolase [Alphaproteobacteria bacterium]
MTAGGRDPGRYRSNVGLALFHRNGLVFLGKRRGAAPPYQWQMPQGGVDRGETPAAAAVRELEEEIGVAPTLVEILEETPDWLYYDFPPGIRGGAGPKGRWLGQKQKWFALRFHGRDADVQLDKHTPEFSDWRWGTLEESPRLVIPFKRAIYEDVARRFMRYTAGAPDAPSGGGSGGTP